MCYGYSLEAPRIAPDKELFSTKIIDIFLICPRNHMLWTALEMPWRGASNEYTQHLFSWRNKKNTILLVEKVPYVEICVWTLIVWRVFVLKFYGPVNPMGSCRARSVYLTTRLLGRQSSKRLTSIVHILSPEADNCPSWISGRDRMTVENISWSISTKECCRPRRGSNPRPPGLQSDSTSTWATEARPVSSGSALLTVITLSTRQIELRTTRPKDKSAQDNSAQKKVGPRQLGPSRPNFRRQLGPKSPQLLKTSRPMKIRHLLMY